MFLVGQVAFADDAATEPSAKPTGQQAIERGLEFLVQDAAKWRKEHECATCHHGTMTVWALNEAKSRGYAVADETLTDITHWTKERLDKIDQPRDERPGWNMVSTPALYLALMAQNVPKQESISRDDLQHIAGHLLRHQEDDGSWIWSSAPAKNRAPPLFESDEVATLLGYMALGPQLPADPQQPSAERGARHKAAEWLAKVKPTDTTQAAAYHLLAELRDGKSADDLLPQIDALFARQNADGGWGQLKELASDGYATGQVLYVLSQTGLKNDRPEIRRAVSFLIAAQQPNGSWLMIQRAQPGATPGKNPIPITYLGSTWATLALIRWVEK